MMEREYGEAYSPQSPATLKFKAATDMLDDENEEAWVNSQRAVVAAYLKQEKVQHGEIAEWPAWHCQPVLAVWAIESRTSPGRVGWWAISGDIPTDYVSFADADHPREVVRHFARHWAELSDFMIRGERHSESNIGTPDQWPELGQLLQRRSNMLKDLAEDHSVWTEIDE